MPPLQAPAATSLPDQQARDAIQTNLNATLFVEAGAGTGKTTALVGRILSLIDDEIPIQNIAAITFTEKAATELQSRIRQKLQEKIQLQNGQPNTPQSKLDKLQNAMDDLDGAPICTLHSFAQRILLEHALDAMLPLRFSCLDEIESEIQFQVEWEDFQTNTLREPKHALALQLAKELGIAQDELKAMARQFRDNWDLVRSYKGIESYTSPQWLPEISELIEIQKFLLRVKDEYEKGAKSEKPPFHFNKARDEKYPKLASAINSLVKKSVESPSFAKELSDLAYSHQAAEKDLAPRTLNRTTETEAALWEAVRNDVPEKVSKYLQQYLESIVNYLVIMVANFTLAQAKARKETGQLIFHDLLVHCLELLKHPIHGPKVRSSLRNRYQRLLIDEFQDTDPIQIELASLIASSPDQTVPATVSGHSDWRNLLVKDGQLFFVGDPKQSIYRFRRANVNLYMEAAEHHGANLTLQANWRSSKPILNWVNQVFSKLIQEKQGSQPCYTPIDAMLSPASDDPGPAVALLGAAPHEKTAPTDELRSAEAQEISKLIGMILQSGWMVSQKRSGLGHKPHRRAKLSDICVLSPTRSNFLHLEKTFADFAIPYQVQVTNNIFASPEIRDLFALLKSIDDPTDEYNVVSSLRSVAFGCGDDDLYDFFRLGGRWDYREDLPETVSPSHPVAESLAWLNEMHLQRNLLSPSQVIEQVIEQRNLLELALAGSSHRDIWRRLSFIADLARKFSEKEAGTLRQFINSLQHLGQNQIVLKEDIVPEADFDAVKIMTVHASKGLEFPIVILANSVNKLTHTPRKAEIIWNDQNQMGFFLRKNQRTKVYEDFEEENKKRELDEAIRMLYVACTRARDHLVVSLHRKDQDKEKPFEELSIQGDFLARASPECPTVSPASYNCDLNMHQYVAIDLEELPEAVEVLGSETLASSQAVPSTGELDFEKWAAEIERIQAKSQQQRIWSSSRVAQTHEPTEVHKEIAELETKAIDWEAPRDSSIGRSATKVGSAVHAVLQTFNLRSLADGDEEQISEALSHLANVQAEANGIHNRTGKAEIKELAESALKSDCVQAASRADSIWKEVYLSAVLEFDSGSSDATGAVRATKEMLLDGCIDLAYRDADGYFVIVDYKTDNSTSLDLFTQKLSRYRIQVAAYALAVEKTTGEKVSSCVLLFIPRKEHNFMKTAQEVRIEGAELAAAKAEVEEFLSAQT